MLTGEYLILHGAKAIALPTKLGQSLTVKPSRGSDLIWVAKGADDEKWFEAQISLFDFSAIKTTDEKIAEHLGKVLKNAVRLNSEFLDKWNGYKVETKLDFHHQWGLGSSSTLIHNVASWAEVNPYYLHFKLSNGSGYDIACASAEGPIEYSLSDDEINISTIDFSPKFKDNLFFIYLNKKQSSQEEVTKFLKQKSPSKETIEKISDLSTKILASKSFAKFEQFIQEHEEILSKVLSRPTVKEEKFSDYWGSIKSLGSWGGDFVLATSDKSVKDTTGFFKEKGYESILPYRELILES